MEKKKVFIVIAVLLVALVSVSTIIYADQDADDKMQSNTTAAQNSNETQEEEVGAEEKPVRYMFVQTAHSGSFVAVEGVENKYNLTLKDVSPQTIAFSDRPARVVRQVQMQPFLDGLGFSLDNPPNAAIEVLEGDEEEDVIVMELYDPVYDAANKTLQYTISILEGPDHSYAIFNERHDESVPEQFGAVALFIDDCSDCYVCCYKDDAHEKCCGCYRIGRCYSFPFDCEPCREDIYYHNKCKELYGEDCYHWCEQPL